MDFKKIVDKVKDAAEDLKEKAKEVAGMAKEKFEQATAKGAADEGIKKS